MDVSRPPRLKDTSARVLRKRVLCVLSAALLTFPGVLAEAAVQQGTGASAQNNSTAVGDNASATGDASVAVGADSSAKGKEDSSLPDQDAEGSYLDFNSVSVGYGASSSNGGTAIGSNAVATGLQSVAVGEGAQSIGFESVALGSKSQALEKGSLAIGNGSISSTVGAIAFGLGASSSGGSESDPDDFWHYPANASISIGNLSSSSSFQSIALGNSSSSSGYGSISLGGHTDAATDGSIAIGFQAQATGGSNSGMEDAWNTIGSISIGGNAISTGDSSISVGMLSYSQDYGSVAIGDHASASDQAVAIGIQSVGTSAGTVSFGHKAGDAVGNTDDTYDSDYNRRLINVAAGIDDTDAVNVSQMEAADNELKTYLEDKITSAAAGDIDLSHYVRDDQNSYILGEGASINTKSGLSNYAIGEIASIITDGSLSNVNYSYAIGHNASINGSYQSVVDSYAIGSDASVYSGSSYAIGDGAEVDILSNSAYAIGNNAVVGPMSSGAFAIGHDAFITDNSSSSFAIGLEAKVHEASKSYAIGYAAEVSNCIGSYAIGYQAYTGEDHVISFGHKAGDPKDGDDTYDTDLFNRLVNIADGQDDHDAVTVGQLNEAIEGLSDTGGSVDLTHYIRDDQNNYAIGLNANVSSAFGDSNYAIGEGASVVGGNNTVESNGAINPLDPYGDSSPYYSYAIGHDASVDQSDDSYAIGSNASVGSFSDGAYAIGMNASVGSLSNGAFALGYGAFVSSNSPNSLAIGTDASVYSPSSLAIGTNTSVGDSTHSYQYSVAIGCGSQADDDYVVSFGHGGDPYGQVGDIEDDGHVPDGLNGNLYRRLVNVADGIDAHDVVTVGQLNKAIEGLSGGDVDLSGVVSYDDNGGTVNTSSVTFKGEGGTQLHNVKAGEAWISPKAIPTRRSKAYPET